MTRALKRCAPQPPARAELEGVAFGPHPVAKALGQAEQIFIVTAPVQFAVVAQEFQQQAAFGRWLTSLIG
jgi:hypothetical protein